MSLIVEFELRGEPIEMTALARALPDVTFEIDRFRPAEDLVSMFVWAVGADLDRVEPAIRDLSHLEDVAVINVGTDRRLYRLVLEPNIDAVPEDLLSNGMLIDGTIEPDCLHLRGRVAGRDVLVALWQYLRQREISVSVTKLSRADGSGGDDAGPLTDAQLEALATAYEMGYFDDARGVTQSMVAEELGISRSSFSERLRRAEQRLVESRLEVADRTSV